MAHEVGHNIGLNHDMGRRDKWGRNCHGVGGYMDYEGWKSSVRRWSQCSKEDLTKYYNQHGGSRSFCLNPGTGNTWFILVDMIGFRT